MNKLLKTLGIIFLFIIGVAACNKESGKEPDEFRAEDYDGYYWYEGTKIPLQKMDSKFYVVFYLADEEIIRDELSKEGIELKYSEGPKDYSHRPINIIGTGARKLTNFKTAIIEGSYEKASTALSHALYWAPFYKTEDGIEVGITELVSVTLKPGTDLAQLEKLAKENSVEIIGSNIYAPNWYILACTNQSKGNSLQMANLFHESGLFEYACPETMADITPA